MAQWSAACVLRAPNIEHYELDPPPNPSRTPWPRPVPDVLHYAWRDYGNRAGIGA